MKFTTRPVKWLMLVALVILILVTVAVWPHPSAAASPVPVRFTEGVFHGFLILRSVGGDQIASGDLRQIATGGKIKTHMSFRFTDGSVLDESVMYTQDQVFSMQTYHLIQRGPVFPEDIDATLERPSGKYSVKTKDHKDGKEELSEGTVDLPGDVYNGMILTVLKNFEKGAAGAIHLVAFTPYPEVVELQLTPSGQEKISIGGTSRTAYSYTLHPELSGFKKLLATLTGRVPPDGHILILADEVPTFLRFRGQLFMGGPIWRIELTSPETEGHRETER